MKKIILTMALLLPTPLMGANKIACYGDSVTQGWGVDEVHKWCSKIGGVNFGVSGATSSSALAWIRDVARARPKIVIIMFGLGNAYPYDDRGTTVEQYREDLKRMIAYFGRRRIKIILMTSNPTLDVSYNQKVKPFIKMMRQIAGEEEILLVDNYSQFSEAFIEGREVMIDYAHPNNEGSELIYQGVIEKLSKLKRRERR